LSPHKGTSATSLWAAHLIINRMKKRDSRRAKAQDGHTVVAESSMMRSRKLVTVHAGRRKKERACMCHVTSRKLQKHHAANFIGVWGDSGDG